MTTHYEKLIKLIEEIMYLNTRFRTEELSTKEKYTIYQSGTIMIREAKKELQELIEAIRAIKQPPKQSTTVSTQHDRALLRLKNSIELGGELPVKGSTNVPTMLKIREIFPILQEFQKLYENIPTKAEIFNDMENDVMYEDAESYVAQ